MEDEETRLIEQKKIEFCIIFWLGLFLVPVSLVFWAFYIEKMDTINNDTYAMVRGPETVNSQITGDTRAIQSYYFQVNGILMDSSTLTFSRPNNYLFISIIHTLLFIGRSGRSSSENIFTYTKQFPTGVETDLINLTFYSTANGTSVFIPLKLMETDVANNDNNAQVTRYLTRADILIFRNFQNSIGLGDVFYQESTATPQSYQIYVRDAQTMKEPYTFPPLEQWGYAPISLITLGIGLFLVIVFLWHWWSVKYIVIEVYIRKHIKNNKWY